jgi:hypothetical protein
MTCNLTRFYRALEGSNKPPVAGVFLIFKREIKSYLWNFQIGLWIYECYASHIKAANSRESGIAVCARVANMKKYEQSRHTLAAAQKTSGCRVLPAMDRMRHEQCGGKRLV